MIKARQRSNKVALYSSSRKQFVQVLGSQSLLQRKQIPSINVICSFLKLIRIRAWFMLQDSHYLQDQYTYI